MPVCAKDAGLPGGTHVTAQTNGSAVVVRPSIRQWAVCVSPRYMTMVTAFIQM